MNEMAPHSFADEQPWGHYQPRGLTGLLMRVVRSRRMRKRLQRLTKTGPIYDIVWQGLKVRCHTADNATERALVLRSQHVNREEISLLMAELSEGGTFLDVGANNGVFSLSASAKASRVIAIEPNPLMVKRLRFNIAANGLTNIAVVQLAVGDAPGNATLYQHPIDLGRSSITEETKGQPISVGVQTLAQILADQNVSQIDAMKIDVEGFEDRVLLPFIDSAPRSLWPRAILMEIVHGYRWHDACFHRLLQAGYAVKWQSSMDALLILK